MIYDVIILSNREVFAQRYSISQKEHYDAGVLELNPEYRFDVRMYEYQGENTLMYDGVKYAIYRTYQKGDYIELYVAKKTGVF